MNFAFETIEAEFWTLDGEAGSVLDLATSLLDKHFVQQRESVRGGPRLLMLETIREYGVECLAIARNQADLASKLSGRINSPRGRGALPRDIGLDRRTNCQSPGG